LPNNIALVVVEAVEAAAEVEAAAAAVVATAATAAAVVKQAPKKTRSANPVGDIEPNVGSGLHETEEEPHRVSYFK
jgi:hypothetical protein